MSIDPALSMVLRGALALLLASAARHKLLDFEAFRAALAAYALLPSWALNSISAALAATEAVLALTLLLPATAGVAALGAAGLLTLYAAAIAINLRRGRRDIDCGCAGPMRRQTISSVLVGRNLVLVAASAAAALPVAARDLGWIDAVTLTAGVSALALLYLSIDSLIVQPSALEVSRA